MENTSTAVNEASATSSTETSTSGNSDALAGKSFTEAAMEYADTKESERLKLDNDNKEIAAKDHNEVSEKDTDGSQRQREAEKGEISPGVKKRIDGLTAKLNKERESHKQLALENAKLREAMRLWAAENERIAQYAQLDPNVEKIRSLELQREIDQIERRVPEEISARFAQAEQESLRNEQVSSLAESIREATSEYSGLFSARELALYMKQTNGRNPALAAKALADARIAAVQSRTKTPPAPMTASGVGIGNREPAKPWSYQGSSSIEAFMEQKERERKGR